MIIIETMKVILFYFETNPSIFPSLVSTEVEDMEEERKDPKIAKNGKIFIFNKKNIFYSYAKYLCIKCNNF